MAFLLLCPDCCPNARLHEPLRNRASCHVLCGVWHALEALWACTICFPGSIGGEWLLDYHSNKTGIMSVYLCMGSIISTKTAPETFAMIPRTRCVCSYTIQAVQSYNSNATETMKAHTKTFCSLRRCQWAVLCVSLPKASRKGHMYRSNLSPSQLPPKIKKPLH